MRLMWLGTYERDYPRGRVLIEGLREDGVEVVECHRPVWERERHKAGAFLRPLPLARTLGRFAGAWGALAVEGAREPGVNAIVAGYPAQPDALPAWCVARARRVPLAVNMMISLADTLAGDRARAGRLAGAALAGVDRATLAAADLVVADTAAGADWLAARFGVPSARLAVVPVGAEPDRFPALPQPDGPPVALFYGKLAPLHGVATVLEAARRPGAPRVRLIGDGQLGPWLERELARDRPQGLSWERWVPYEALGAEVGRAAICLGVFGESAKAARVVPNKVWQAMAGGAPGGDRRHAGRPRGAGGRPQRAARARGRPRRAGRRAGAAGRRRGPAGAPRCGRARRLPRARDAGGGGRAPAGGPPPPRVSLT